MSMGASGNWATKAICRTPRWLLPVSSVLAGLVVAGAMWAGGDGRDAPWAVGVMSAYAAFLAAFSGRHEVVGMMSGQTPDERARSINLRATAVTGNVLIVVLVVGTVVSIAVNGPYANVLSMLSALSGLTWLAALVVLSRRS